MALHVISGVYHCYDWQTEMSSVELLKGALSLTRLSCWRRYCALLLSYLSLKNDEEEEDEHFRYIKINFRDQRQFRVEEEPRILKIDHTMKVKCVLKR